MIDRANGGSMRSPPRSNDTPFTKEKDVKRLIILSSAVLTLSVMLAAPGGNALAQNPIVEQWGGSSAWYDPFVDHWNIERNTFSVRASAYDPDRNFPDPGSRRYVDRIVYDAFGQPVREYGWEWTSNGIPHGDLTRDQVTQIPGATINSSAGISYAFPGSQQPGFSGNFSRPTGWGPQPGTFGGPTNQGTSSGTTIFDRQGMSYLRQPGSGMQVTPTEPSGTMRDRARAAFPSFNPRSSLPRLGG
jgi:hypothetical protein